MEDNKNIIEEKLNSEEIPASEEAAETAAQEPKARPKDERPVMEGILDIQEENSFGFLRFDNFLTSDKLRHQTSSRGRAFWRAALREYR